MYMKLQTDYAIRIVDYLSRAKTIKCAQEISEETSVPLRFSKNILQLLAKGEILISWKGVNGGYELAKNKAICLHDVLTVMNEPLILNRCLMNEFECSYSPDKQCMYYDIFQEISTEMQARLQTVKFS